MHDVLADQVDVQARGRAFAPVRRSVCSSGIGLGGAEFQLTLLLMLGLGVLPAVIVNKAISLVVVASALVVPYRR